MNNPKFGFIGFGSMAKMIIRGLTEYAGINPPDIYVTRKDKAKLHEIGDTFGGVVAVETCRDIVENADIIFLCPKPLEIKGALLEIVPFATESTHLISIAGCVSIDNLQSVFHGKITKYMPTLPSEVGSGVSLICHNEHVSEADAGFIETIIGKFSDNIKHVNDDECGGWGFASELTSCMPGLIASIFDNLTKAAQNHTESFCKNEIDELVVNTLYATAKFLSETGLSFEQTVSRVATKGGITAQGAVVFDKHLPEVFDEMFEKTLARRQEIADIITADFIGKEG